MNEDTKNARGASLMTIVLGVGVLGALGLGWWLSFGRGAVDAGVDLDRVVLVERKDLVDGVTASGRVEPLARVAVMSRASGIVKELFAEEGDVVKRGQVLAELDREQLEAQLAQDQAELASAEARLAAASARVEEAQIRLEDPELEFWEREFARLSDLYESGDVTLKMRDDAERNLAATRFRVTQVRASLPVLAAAVREATANLQAAQASLDRSETTLREATIRSPIDGVLLVRSKEVGDGVSSILTAGGNATELMTLGDLSVMFIDARVDEVDLGRIQVDMPALVTVDAHRGKVLTGEVARVAPAGSVDNNGIVTFEVRITVSDPEGLLKPDMTADAKLVVARRDGVPTLPQRAFARDERGGWLVRKVVGVGAETRAVPTIVELGLSDGLITEVRAGVSEGDRVLLPGPGAARGRRAAIGPFELIAESLASIGREARRIAPMAIGIVWGVASVFVLVAVGRGFESTQRQALEAMGDSFLLLRVNRATSSRGDVRADAFVRLEGEDMAQIEAGAPSVAAISPKANNWFIQGTRGSNISRVVAVGIEPDYAGIVSVPLLPGSRWIDQNDLEQELPVCVIGYGVRAELFGEEPWLGEEIQLVFSRDAGDDTVLRRLTVIGALTDNELAGDQIYTSHRRVVFMPFTTWERMSPRGFQFFVLRPTEPDAKQAALAEVREVLGRRHGFDPANENTLVPYFDAIERKRTIDGVFGGLQVFLLAVGVLILLLGAVGVANVVLMSVAARTFEFGLRRALGCQRHTLFAQVFLEAALVCTLSGLVGFGLGALGVGILGTVDLPAGFAAPRAEWGAAWLPGLLLLVVSLGAAAWPATRAARLSVVDALREVERDAPSGFGSIVREAASSLFAHPLRSGLTALSVTFGAAVLFLLLAYATGIPDTTASILRSMGSKEFIVEPRRSRGPGGGGSRQGRMVRIRYADIDAVRGACPSIAGIAPAYRPGRGGPVFSNDRSWPWAVLTGVGHAYREVTDMGILRGRWFTPEEELGAEELALISKPLVDGMYDGREPLGETIDAWGRRFRIIGVFESNATFAYSLIVPYPTAMEMGDTGGRYVSELAFAPLRPDLARSAIDEIREALGALYSFDPDDPSAIDVKENTAFVEQVETVSLGLEALVLTIAVLALVLGCLGAANVVGIAVAERTAEIGLRKALGATAARVRAEVLFETLFLCVLGGALGVGIGALGVGAMGELRFSDQATLAPRFDATLLLAAFGVLVATAVLAGLPAARRAARLEPIAALREE